MRMKLQMQANPIMVKELRSRMRGMRAFATLTGVLLLLGGISYGLYRIMLATANNPGTPLSPRIGQALFVGLALLELIMVCGITPAVTAGTISGEKEKQTYEMLMATPLRPARILWGKLISALSYVFLLLFAAVPMASLVFIFGGVTLRDMLKALLVLVSVAVMFGVLGLFMSALFGRSGRATALSYLFVLGMLFAPMFLAVAVGVLRQSEPPRWILVPSPINVLFSAILPSTSINGISNIFWILGGAWSGIFSTPISQTSIPRPLYHYSLPFYGAFTVVLYLLTTRLVQPTRRWRIGWKGALIAAGILLGFCGAVGLAFLASSNRYEKGSLFIRPTPQVVTGPVMVQPPAIRPVMEVTQVYPAPQVQAKVPPTPTPFPRLPSGIYFSSSSPYPPPDYSFSPDEPGKLPDESDQAAVLVALIRHLYTQESENGELGTEIQSIRLIRRTDDQVGDQTRPYLGNNTLEEKVQEQVIQILAGAESQGFPTLEWIDWPEQARTPWEIKTSREDEAIIVFGNILLQGDGDAWLASAGIFTSQGASGGSFYLAQADGEWQVNGDKGVRWTRR